MMAKWIIWYVPQIYKQLNLMSGWGISGSFSPIYSLQFCAEQSLMSQKKKNRINDTHGHSVHPSSSHVQLLLDRMVIRKGTVKHALSLSSFRKACSTENVSEDSLWRAYEVLEHSWHHGLDPRQSLKLQTKRMKCRNFYT